METTTTVIDVCSRCHASTTLTTYPSPFLDGSTRGCDIPSPSAVSDLGIRLATAQSEFATLTSDIQSLATTLNALKLHHAHLARYIKQAVTYASLSPIRRLPTEVLELIFLAACDSFQPDEYLTPLSISLVCSKWRDLALSNQMLWTHIYVDYHSQEYPDFDRSDDILDLYLSRCSDPRLPLYMKLDLPAVRLPTELEREHAPHFYEDYEQCHLWPIWSTAPRWREAELHINKDDFSSLWKGNRQMPLIETLTVAFRERFDRRERFPRYWPQFNTPSLRKLVMLDIRIEEDEDGDQGDQEYESLWRDGDLPLAQLRQIETDEEDLSDLFYLRKRFAFDGSRDNEREHGRCLTIFSPTIEMPYITSLTLHLTSLVLKPGVWSKELVTFIRILSVPTLLDLTLAYPEPDAVHGEQWTNALSAVPAFLDRSKCELKRFTFVMRGIYEDTDESMTAEPPLPDTLLKALQDMSALETLKIVEAISGPQLISDKLVERMSKEEGFLSRVRSLELVWGEDHTPNRDALMTMIASRVERKVGLSSVVLGLRNGGDLDPQIQSFLCGLRGNGIDARLW